jgi:hypothetical protein
MKRRSKNSNSIEACFSYLPEYFRGDEAALEDLDQDFWVQALENDAHRLRRFIPFLKKLVAPTAMPKTENGLLYWEPSGV